MVQFHGRLNELERIDAALRPGAPVTILGTAGTGKTRLALEVTRRRPDVVVLDDLVLRGSARALVQEVAEQRCVLITGRDIAGLQSEHVVALGPLPVADALAMAAELLGAETTPDEVAELVAMVDGLPGAIMRLSEVARVLPLRQALDALQRTLDQVRATNVRLPRSATMAIVDDWTASRRVA